MNRSTGYVIPEISIALAHRGEGAAATGEKSSSELGTRRVFVWMKMQWYNLSGSQYLCSRSWMRFIDVAMTNGQMEKNKDLRLRLPSSLWWRDSSSIETRGPETNSFYVDTELTSLGWALVCESLDSGFLRWSSIIGELNHSLAPLVGRCHVSSPEWH